MLRIVEDYLQSWLGQGEPQIPLSWNLNLELSLQNALQLPDKVPWHWTRNISFWSELSAEFEEEVVSSLAQQLEQLNDCLRSRNSLCQPIDKMIVRIDGYNPVSSWQKMTMRVPVIELSGSEMLRSYRGTICLGLRT